MPETADKAVSDEASDIKHADLVSLASELRREILETVSRQGGHLASNLGVVELMVALHAVFDFPKDRLFFDTGHQCYAHKLLSGRRALFSHLREADGCSGFPLRDESEYDSFGAGHSGTAISAALGFAAARDKLGGKEKIIALVGDGAMGCGSSLEGLNSISVTTRNFILILNDNKMSIAPNVGAISKFLNRIISGRHYNAIKATFADMVGRFLGQGMRKRAGRLELALKSMFIHGNMFGDLGLKYIGPVDGHDVHSLVAMLERIKSIKEPVMLHVITKKGMGYAPAEENPSKFHGTKPFDISSGKPLNPSSSLTFSSAFGGTLSALREEDDGVVAITAGMPGGTGLEEFAKKYPDSFYDVGIAEGHATVFAAGLAAAGLKPVFAVYASFSQRAFDYAFHDVFLQRLPVLFCLDRAGIVEDGPTHHGIQDIGFWRMMPGVKLMQPCDGQELSMMLKFALGIAPAVIRYPSGGAESLLEKHSTIELGRAEVVAEGCSSYASWGVGRELKTALAVAELLKSRGIIPDVVNARFVLPFDRELMRSQIDAGKTICIIEDHVSEGGFGSIAIDGLPQRAGSILKFGWPNKGVGWGRTSILREMHGMTPEKIADAIIRVNGKRQFQN
ncbi:MAG: 1-deoxy-D-xylulose-5-phosphate synthase [Victivallales bacterium]|nr:1-deoxy-D-xylulose-5-phosphate synthase [Victivallales bacterium]